MAQSDKTEKPTPKRRGEARKRGQVAKSSDLNGALILLAGLVAISSLGPAVVHGAANLMRSSFQLVATPGTSTSGAQQCSSALASSNHLRKPSARNRMLTPCSSSKVRASR